MYAWLRRGWAVVVAGALLALAGCGSMDAEAANGYRPPDPWIGGGQTGSLMPRCGLPEPAMVGGVPASSEGFVVFVGECVGSSVAPSDLSLRDANGNQIPFNVRGLDGGAVLITPQAMLPPGTYFLGSRGEQPPIDEDAGSEDDAGSDAPDAGSRGVEETLQVSAVVPEPDRFGTITSTGEPCSATYAFSLEPATAAHASRLAIDVQIDGGEIRPLFAYGTLRLDDGFALVSVPEDVWLDLGTGPHTLKWIARLAGRDAPLETFETRIDTACNPYPYGGGGDAESTACGVSHAARARDGTLHGLSIAGAALLLAHRRRKRS